MRLVLVTAAIARIDMRGRRRRLWMSLGRRRGWSLACLDFGALLRLSRLALLGLCLDLRALLRLSSLALLGLCLNLRALLGLGSLPLLRPCLDLRALLGLLSLTLLCLGSLSRLRPGGLLLSPRLRLRLRSHMLLRALLRLCRLSLLPLFPHLPGLLMPPLLHVRLSTLLSLRTIIGLGLTLTRLLAGAVSLLAGAGLRIPRRRLLARLRLLLLA